MDCSLLGFLCPWDSSGKNTGVSCHAFLQGIFPTQGLNPSLLYCRQILYCLSHQGSPDLNLKSKIKIFNSAREENWKMERRKKAE